VYLVTVLARFLDVAILRLVNDYWIQESVSVGHVYLGGSLL
jgi:hypothetical protein